MKIILINGSPRKNGITAQILQCMQDKLTSNGAETELINLSELNVQHCNGCCSCYRTGHCHIHDDAMWKINEEFLSSQTQAGKTIIFSHSPYDSSYTHLNGKSTSFGREIDYLQNSANYKISDVVNADGYYFAVPK